MAKIGINHEEKRKNIEQNLQSDSIWNLQFTSVSCYSLMTNTNVITEKSKKILF